MVRICGWLVCALAVGALFGGVSVSAAPGDTRHLAHVTPQQLRADCGAGFAFACVDLGVSYQVRGSEAARREAQKLYAIACRKGDPRGCDYLNALIKAAPASDHRVSQTFGDKRRARLGGHAPASSVLPPASPLTTSNAPPGSLVHPASVRVGGAAAAPLPPSAAAAGPCRGAGCPEAVQAKVRPLTAPAQTFLNESCDGGSPTGCLALGAHFEEVGQIGAARDYYGRACKAGSSLGCKSAGALGAYYARPAGRTKAGL